MRSEQGPRRGAVPWSGRARPRVGRSRRSRLSAQNELGSAVVDFVMVGALVITVFVALLQVTLGVYARNVLTDAAGDGASGPHGGGRQT